MKNEELFGAYTLKDLAEDSNKAIAGWRARALRKLQRENEKHGDKIPHLFMALSATLPILIAQAHV